MSFSIFSIVSYFLLIFYFTLSSDMTRRRHILSYYLSAQTVKVNYYSKIIRNIQPCCHRGGAKRFRESYQPNCSQTDLSTDLPMVCKFKFVCYGHIKKVLYVPWFNFDSHLNLRFFNLQALDPKFVLALEPRILKLKGSSFGIRPYIFMS